MNNLTGKGNSLEELIVEHQPRLKAFIRKRVSSKEDAEDILQDVLYQLVKTIESTFCRATKRCMKLRKFAPNEALWYPVTLIKGTVTIQINKLAARN